MATILVLDDDPNIRELLREILTRVGHEVVLDGDGRHALTLVEAHQVDLLITDILMPNRDGIETITALRASHPGLRVIAMTGGSAHMQLYLSIAAKCGAVATLQKPFPPKTLVETVAAALHTD